MSNRYTADEISCSQNSDDLCREVHPVTKPLGTCPMDGILSINQRCVNVSIIVYIGYIM
jgi:hypothetical protein